MSQKDAEKNSLEWNRRDFIRGTSLGSLMLIAGGGVLNAQDKPADAGTAEQPVDTKFSTQCPPVSFGVIGCGAWGREILQTLAVLPNAPIVAVCDNYKRFVKKALEIAPKAQSYDDYKQLLAQKDVEAVVVATPSHLHKEIVLAALAAGKHVYCEAPLAHTVEDARAIAQAARDAFKVNFQAGLQARSDPARLYIHKTFIRVGALGTNVMARSQSHRWESWSSAGGSPERMKEANWRLNQATSPGLIGEIGVHQLDLMNWFLNKRPTAVSGFGGILKWTDDGRDVPDTVQAVFEYPGKLNYMYDATLANSFGGEQDVIYGSYAAVMMTAQKSWLFKESSSDNFGWEIYAMKEEFHKESGIVLAADATKSVKTVAVPTALDAYMDSPLNAALKAFVKNSDMMRSAAKGYIDLYGDDITPEFKALMNVTMTQPRPPELRAAGYVEGYEATVCALKANEATIKGQKIMLDEGLFKI